MGNYISGFLCEIANFFCTVMACYLMGFVWEYEYIGILLGIIIGQSIGFVFYFLNFALNTNFKKVNSIVSLKKCCKKKKKQNLDLKKPIAKNEDNLSIAGSRHSASEMEQFSKFDSLKYYLKFELEFCAMFALEQSWIRSDNIFASFKLSTTWVSALGQLYTVISLVDCFSFGYGFATTKMITDYMLKGQIRKSKIVCVIS